MVKTSIQDLAALGQSVWLDNINRSMIEKGILREMIAKGLRGVTSNPSIFDKAISLSKDYDQKIFELFAAGKSTFDTYDELTIKDIQDAADIFLPVHEETSGLDGYISLEVNPKLAYATEATVKEGLRLHRQVNRPNLMLKVPSTEQGYQAVEELTAHGINVNVTLIFSVEQYRNSARAYIRGIKRFLQNKGEPKDVRSVASVFVSRVDTLVDKLLDQALSSEQANDEKEKINSLKGKAAVANSSLIYGEYWRIFSGPEFKELKQKGVNAQRVLWGSTSTKNPAYSDIKYVSELIARNTINTMPEVTFQAFLDHGIAEEALGADIAKSEGVIGRLSALGIDVNEACEQLLKDGVIAFERSFESLLKAIEKKAASLCKK
ncbi:MAG: transaldolase [Candidatus Omnitrophica bacterium]|nr:transaldolase [Candidatus Omnitrophota bacterium]